MVIEGLFKGWQVLNSLLGELEKEGLFIPDLTYADLRNAKMVIEYLRSFKKDIASSDNADVDLQREIEIKLLRLKDAFMAWAAEKRGDDYRAEWEKKFREAISDDSRETSDEGAHISDLPREKDLGYFRIRLPDEIPVEVISEIAEDCEVLIHLDGERHLQVSGKRECVRLAMERIGELFYGDSQFKQ